MNLESLLPFLVILGVFLFAFFLEALVLFFFKIKAFWAALGIAVLINLVSFILVYYVAGSFLSKLGYEVGQFNGLNIQYPQMLAFLWWFSTVAEGLLLQLFVKGPDKRRSFLASMVMNALSYLFLYVFIINSH